MVRIFNYIVMHGLKLFTPVLHSDGSRSLVSKKQKISTQQNRGTNPKITIPKERQDRKQKRRQIQIWEQTGIQHLKLKPGQYELS